MRESCEQESKKIVKPSITRFPASLFQESPDKNHLLKEAVFSYFTSHPPWLFLLLRGLLNGPYL